MVGGIVSKVIGTVRTYQNTHVSVLVAEVTDFFCVIDVTIRQTFAGNGIRKANTISWKNTHVIGFMGIEALAAVERSHRTHPSDVVGPTERTNLDACPIYSAV